MPTTPPIELRNARFAVAAMFFTNGALLANLIPRYPEIKATLELTNTWYGVAIAAMPTGAILAGLSAAGVMRRIGSARMSVFGTWICAIAMLGAGWAPSVWWFGLALFAAGACDALVDVGQNAHGLRVQRGFGRSILNSFHASWSIGAVAGGLMATGAIRAGLSTGVHLTISALIVSVMAAVALKFSLPGVDPAPPVAAMGANFPQPRSRFSVSRRRAAALTLTTLVLLALASSVVEDSGFTWATVYLTQEFSSPAHIAAWGFIALVGAQFIGRMLGDRFVDRFGQRPVAQVSGMLIAVGMGLALLFPSVPGTIAGFAAAGLGTATIIPAAFQAADEIEGLRPGVGLTVVSWLMRLAFLTSPPLVGKLADSVGLRWGLMIVPIAGLVIIACSPVLSKRKLAGQRAG